ncbi:MAG: mechanosensitive ion channel [Fulvivirga sp.]|nr:mechanosensitive ion channel [Fulvivirga sp.]
MQIEQLLELDPWWVALIIFAAALILGLIVRLIFFALVGYYATKRDEAFVQSLQKRLKGSVFLFIPLIILRVSLEELYPEQFDMLNKLIEVFIVISLAIVIIKLIYVFQDVLYDRYDISKEDNLKARKARTQIMYLRKIAIVVVVILALSTILLSFESVRKYGATLLTSAGVAGIIIGFAAQKTLANLLAGIQIAFTQPIKIDDALVVEGEWGWVEEINLTYVVVKIWDMRRLVLPITYFTENTFQNWTRSSSEILGSVFLYVDYTAPLDKLREHFDKTLASTDLWDQQGKAFQITDNSERTMTIRLLMSAKNSPEAWELRCFVREEMLLFIQQNYPHALPKTRAVIASDKKLDL